MDDNKNVIIETEQDGKIVRAIMHIDGTMTTLGEKSELDKMLVPVHCNHCGRNYDLCNGIVVHRYADCTLYKTPCCDKLADDREYKSCPDFSRIPK